MGGRDRAFPLDSDAPVSGPGSSSSVAKRWWTHRNRGSEGDQLADKEIQWREAIFFIPAQKEASELGDGIPQWRCGEL